MYLTCIFKAKFFIVDSLNNVLRHLLAKPYILLVLMFFMTYDSRLTKLHFSSINLISGNNLILYLFFHFNFVILIYLHMNFQIQI